MRLNVVPPRTGLVWVRQGMRTFLRQPLALAGIFFMLWSLVFVLNVIPFVGLAAALVVLPSVAVGYMAATADASQGVFPRPTRLFTAFKAWREKRALPALGASHAMLVLAVFFTASLFAPVPGDGQVTPEVLMAILFSPAMLVACAIQVVLNLAWAHASALALWHGVPAAKALFFTAVALWRNLPAFIVFFLGWAALAVALVLAIATLLRAVGLGQPAFFMPFALLVFAMACTSLWFTFRDTYEEPPPPSPTSDGETP